MKANKFGNAGTRPPRIAAAVVSGKKVTEIAEEEHRGKRGQRLLRARSGSCPTRRKGVARSCEQRNQLVRASSQSGGKYCGGVLLCRLDRHQFGNSWFEDLLITLIRLCYWLIIFV